MCSRRRGVTTAHGRRWKPRKMLTISMMMMNQSDQSLTVLRIGLDYSLLSGEKQI
jgi:hypothetical protein